MKLMIAKRRRKGKKFEEAGLHYPVLEYCVLMEEEKLK